MNPTTILYRSLFFLGLLLVVSCGKDDDDLLHSDDDVNFYRMMPFEVETDPTHREVRILFQVRDKDFDGVAGVTEEDLNVYENNGSIDLEGGLTLNPGNIPSELKTVLLLDLTRSVEGLVPQIKAACISMIDNKLPEQTIAIYTFDSESHLLQDFTTDATALKAAINGMPETNLVNSTNLYGGVISVSDLWNDVFTIQAIEDGSLIVFTDGRHNATPAITLEDAKDALGPKKTYVAALNSADLDETALIQLAGREDRYYKADNIAGLEQMFINIQRDIQNLSQSIYYLTYQSPITDPTPYENTLRVEIDGNRNVSDDKEILESFNSAGFGN
ncbi:MAG: VWA domain-containing protein [Saprospiraceae bacterium]